MDYMPEQSKIAAVTKIITHPGDAHRDDFYSIALALARFPNIEIIERRQPTIEELGNPGILVLDVGERYHPACWKFDHHQPEFRGKAVSTFTLLLDALELSKIFSRLEWPGMLASIDNIGPMVTATALGCTAEVIAKLQFPLESFFFGHLREQPVITRTDGLFVMMKDFGLHLVQSASLLDERIKALKQGGAEILEINKIKGVFITVADHPSLGVNIYLKETYPDDTFAFSIAQDDRGPGWVLYRFNDDPRIHFDLLSNSASITFIHPNGFVAKTKAISKKAAIALVKQAILHE